MGHPHLRRAPIVEARVDLKISPETESIAGIEPFAALVAADFPTRTKVAQLSANFHVGEEGGPPEFSAGPSHVRGAILTSADGRNAVQARLDGFSFSNLGKYDDWSTLRTQARLYWEKYVETVRPSRVNRWALRFINRIDLPLPLRDFGDYLRTQPQIAPDLPQGLSEYFMRLVIPFPAATVIITQTIDVAGVTADRIPVILDIDAFESGDLPPSGEDVWARLDHLREIKNDVFFKSVTEKTWRMYE